MPQSSADDFATLPSFFTSANCWSRRPKFQHPSHGSIFDQLLQTSTIEKSRSRSRYIGDVPCAVSRYEPNRRPDLAASVARQPEHTAATTIAAATARATRAPLPLHPSIRPSLVYERAPPDDGHPEWPCARGNRRIRAWRGHQSHTNLVGSQIRSASFSRPQHGLDVDDRSP